MREVDRVKNYMEMECSEREVRERGKRKSRSLPLTVFSAWLMAPNEVSQLQRRSRLTGSESEEETHTYTTL